MRRKERKPPRKIERSSRRKGNSPEASTSFSRNAKKKTSKSRSKSRSKIKGTKKTELAKLEQHDEKVNSLYKSSRKYNSPYDFNESKLRKSRSRSRKKVKPITKSRKTKSQPENGSNKSDSNGGRRRTRRSNRKGREVVSENELESKPRIRRSQTVTKVRRKPHSLPPLPRTAKSHGPRPRTAEEEQELRRLIGSPPPTRLLRRRSSRGSSGSSDHNQRETWDGYGNRPYSSSADQYDEEHTVYTPSSYLESSHPRITVARAPRSNSSYDDRYQYYRDNEIVSANQSERSFTSMGSLVQSASSLSLNSSLTLPPKLLSYRAKNGSHAVQEWVPDDRSMSTASSRSYSSRFRRNSTPTSIRDLPSPLEGSSPLDSGYRRYPHSQRQRRQLKPLRK